MKKIAKLTDKIKLKMDSRNYMIEIKNNVEDKRGKRRFFPNLEETFGFILRKEIKSRLTAQQIEDVKEVKEIVEDAKQEVESMVKDLDVDKLPGLKREIEEGG